MFYTHPGSRFFFLPWTHHRLLFQSNMSEGFFFFLMGLGKANAYQGHWLSEYRPSLPAISEALREFGRSYLLAKTRRMALCSSSCKITNTPFSPWLSQLLLKKRELTRKLLFFNSSSQRWETDGTRILPHDGGSVESSKPLAMGCRSDFVGGRLEAFPFSLFFNCHLLHWKFRSKISVAVSKRKMVVEFMGLKPRLNLITF